MRVFVTGGNGFIGSVVVRKLIEQGRTVRCLLRDSSSTTRIADLSFERVPGDVRDPNAVAEGIWGCDAAIHLAAIANWNHISARSMEDVVVGGTRNVLAAARQTGCSKVVYVSSNAAVGGSRRPYVFHEESERPSSLRRLVYARTKADAERLCLEAAREGLHVVIVNPCEVFGPNDITLVTAGNLADFARSSPVLICDGGICVVHVEDVATGILAALERGRSGERYILGGENLSIRQLAELTLEVLGRKKRIVQLPNWMLRAMGWLGRHLRVRLPFNPEVVPYATLYWYMDSSKAQRELQVSFRSARETLRPTVQWLQESGYIQ